MAILPPRHCCGRDRGRYALAALVVVGLGLATRSEWLALPAFLAKYAGDALWAVLVFLMLAILLPTRGTAVVASLAIFVCAAVELSQLYHAPWINAVRRTWFGRVALGDTFAFGDIVSYLVGIAFASVIECVVRPRLKANGGS